MNLEKDLPVEFKQELHIFRKNLPLRIKLHEIIRTLGSVEMRDVCLEMGASNSVMSSYLRRHGGKWHSVVFSEEVANDLRRVVKDNIHIFKNTRNFPFKKKVFDIVVILDGLKGDVADLSFIENCHKMLKPDGRLIVCVQREKSFTIITPLRKILGLGQDKKDSPPVFSESQLFSILKDGFDVINIRSYSRFFVELTDLFVRFIIRRMNLVASDKKAIMSFYTVAGFFYMIASQLDMLLFLSKGHYLIAIAKRRAWRPRNAPVLTDGRSISEAVLRRIDD